MKLFLLNILLAILWTFVWGSFDFYTLTAGFILGYLLLGIYSRVTDVEGYGSKAWSLMRFSIWFLRILIKANLQIAYEVLTPSHHMTPRILRYNVEGLSDVQVTALTNAITLTPGTLVVDISNDRKYLYVHAMYAHNRASAVGQLDELKRRLLKEVF